MMRIVKRLAAIAALVAAPAIAAAAWPEKPVKIVVPFAAGGTTDVVARLLAQRLGDVWGQSVIVENKLGAGGNIGADVVAKAAPDGYTLLLTSGAIVSAPHMYKGMTYDPVKDLVAITNVATGPQVIAVSAGSPFKDLSDLIAFARANPKKVNFGSAGIGSQTHLCGENFAYAATVDLTHVPYKGESAALTDLLGGQIQLVTPNLGGAITQIQQGRLRALGVTSTRRDAHLPDVPAVAEILPGFENAGWFGLLAPTGTPREVIERVYKDSAKIVVADEFRAKLDQQGMVPVGNSPAEFAAAMREESARWAKVIRDRGLAQN